MPIIIYNAPVDVVKVQKYEEELSHAKNIHRKIEFNPQKICL